MCIRWCWASAIVNTYVYRFVTGQLPKKEEGHAPGWRRKERVQETAGRMQEAPVEGRRAASVLRSRRTWGSQRRVGLPKEEGSQEREEPTSSSHHHSQKSPRKGIIGIKGSQHRLGFALGPQRKGQLCRTGKIIWGNRWLD